MQDYTAVKDVIGICRDAEQGFRGAANAAKNPLLKELFEQYSVQRGEFANQLHEIANAMGLDVRNPIGIAGVMHSGFMHFKGALHPRSDLPYLEETGRGDELSLKTYRQALALNISDEVRPALADQRGEIERAHQRIHELPVSAEATEQRTRTAG